MSFTTTIKDEVTKIETERVESLAAVAAFIKYNGKINEDSIELYIENNSVARRMFNLIKRLSNNIILCLDGDEPGVHAMLSIGDHLLEQGVEVKVVVLPNDDDPDSFILKNGKDRFVGLIENALNFSDFKMQQLRKNVDFRSDEEKSNYINTVLKETVKINDSIRVEIVLKRLAKEFDISYNTLEKRFRDLIAFKNTSKTVALEVKSKEVKKTKYDKAVEQILYFMLNNDWVISQVEGENIVFPSEESRILSSEIIYYYKLYGNINVADFYTYVQDKEDILILLNSILAGNYNEKTNKEELFQYFKVIREYRCSQEIKRLTNLMKKEVDPLEQAKIANKIRNLRMGE